LYVKVSWFKARKSKETATSTRAWFYWRPGHCVFAEVLKYNKAGFVVNAKSSGGREGRGKIIDCWEWRRNCQKEPKNCAVSKRQQDLKYLISLPLVSSWYFLTFFFYMNEKILMGKYKRRKDNVIWGKEDGCPPSPLPRILFPFSTPATPFLFSAHWRRKYDQIVRLHDYRACVVSSICTDCYRILFYADSRCLITCESVILSTSVCRSVILMEPLDVRGKK